ncbi:MAG TPA: hypothetical protein VF960_12395, partial [Chloroflexota bacterium]
DAGYGKTSLVTEFTRLAGLRSEWYQLTSKDRDVARLAEGLGACLHRLAGDAERPALTGARARSAKSRDVNILGELLLAQGDQTGPGEACLVLDDYQAVDQDPGVNQLLGTLIENGPASLRFIILSRSIPKFAIGKLKARQEVYTIGEDELSFTPDETACFLNGLGGSGLEKGTIDLVQERTEGWPAGVAMVSQSLRHGGQERVMSVLADPAASAWLVYDYLAEEVFDRQEPPVREFLVKSSILSTMTAPICDHLLGIGTSQRILLGLEESGLFTASTDPARTTFRFHQLFREFLRQKLHQLQSRDALTALHLRAAQYYESHGVWEECVDHYLKGGEPVMAAEVVESIGEKHVMAGFLLTVVKWLQALPEDLTTTRPWLLVLRARLSYLSVDNQEALRMLERALRSFQSMGDQHGEAYAMREIGFVKTRSQQLQQAIRQYELALVKAEGMSHLKGTILCRMGRTCRDVGKLDDTLANCRLAIEEAETIEDQTARLEVKSHAGRQTALANLEKGNLKAALKAGLETLDLGASCDLGEYERTWEFIDLGVVLWASGELDGAMESLNRALSLSGRHIRQVQERIFSWLGTVLRDSGRFAEAERAYELGGWEAGPERAFLDLLTHQADSALSRARELHQQWHESDNLVARSAARVVLAAALRESGDREAALDRIKEAVRLLEDGGYTLRSTSALLHQSRLEFDLGLPEAGETLRRAFAVSAARGFFHFFWWDPRLVGFLCERAARDGIEPEYAAALAGSRLSPVSAPAKPAQTPPGPTGAEQSSHVPPTTTTARAPQRQLLELLAGCADPEIRDFLARAVEERVITEDGIRALRVAHSLTWRELEVFIEYYLRPTLAAGTAEAPLRISSAMHLGISAYTVRYHVNNIRSKLALPPSLSGRGILVWVQRQGWLPASDHDASRQPV